MRAVVWGSDTWGQPGHNVTVADNGSYWGHGEHQSGVIEP